MTEQIALLIAASIAFTVVVLAHLLTKLVRTMVDKGGGDAWRTPRLVRAKRVRTQRVEPARFVDDESAGLAHEPARAEPAGHGGPPGLPATPVARDVQKGGVDLKPWQPKPQAGLEAGHKRSVDRATAYREVGDEVTAVLAAAEHAAAQIQSKAEEQAHRITAEAERKSREIEADAARRRDALTKGAERMEARIESLLTTFRGVVAELEELLPAERRSGADKPEPSLDDALKHQLSSHADSTG